MEKINNFLNNVFASLPSTKDVVDLRKSIEQGMNERYQDLVNEGKSEAEAFGIVVSDFGNIEDIRRELNLESHFDHSMLEDIYMQEQNQRDFNKKFGIAIAGGVLFCIWGVFGSAILAMFEIFPAFFLMNFVGSISIGVGIFIYWGIAKVNNDKGDLMYNSSFQQGRTRSKAKVAAKIGGIVYPIVTLIYLIIGAFFGGWHPWWILFPAAAVLISALTAIMAHE